MMTMSGGKMQVKKPCVVGVVLFLLALPAALLGAPRIQHDLRVVLQPDAHHLQVTDHITFPPASPPTWHFRLHAGLHPTSPTPGVRLVRQQTDTHVAPDSLPVESYTVTVPPDVRTWALQYAGTIFHPLPQQGAEYSRGFRDTPGLISADGAFLSGATFWYPRFDAALLSFTLEVQLPPNWEAVSQGERTQHEKRDGWAHVRWESPQPQEQIYLVGAPFTTYSQPAGTVQAMAFLRTPDMALAQKYLETTAQYLTMYNELIGPYPYSKFALVENFWQSGYGMPSFTLLGSQVIRFPFILHSSYPHEILHNWWGNGVFVEAEGGNWSEGLTAYLADHLIQEQRGTAVTYRRTSLQKYTDYVATARDFPLTAFRARHDSVTEAVGYGKTMMLFHMLRLQLGDAEFTRGLQAFYRAYRFRRASFDDLIRTFADTAGVTLQPTYSQWITHPGAPELRLHTAEARAEGATYTLTAVVEQVQPGPAYPLRLPLAMTLEGQEQAFQTTVEMDTKRLELALHLTARPLRLDIDPQFDVFRRLHRGEIPPALTQLFGAPRVLLLLPAAAPEALRQGYRQLAQTWQHASSASFEIRWDNEITALPSDGAVWLFGWENRWRAQLEAAVADYPVTMRPDSVRLDHTELTRTTHTLVVTAHHPQNAQQTLGWIATENAAALPGLGRKLPHYGKYSYLGFTGDEPVNVAKGQWPVVRSPMSGFLPQADGRVTPVVQAQLAPRRALASLPAVFSTTRMQQVIQWLASEEMRGRGFATPELDRAADYLAMQFREAGLQPAGDDPESYFHSWRARGGDPEREGVLKNIVGFIPGTKPEWASQSVVVGAHYDHLGLGWPDVHRGEVGMIHPGADDNASGVAVLLELARVLGKAWQPERTVIFIAFSGEEAGRLGSQHYVTHANRWPVADIMGMINLDSVGRLGQNKLLVLGTASADEWLHIFQGAGYVTGVPVEPVAQDWGSSDQRSFLEAGVPAVQLFSGPHLDYHRPTDTVDKIDAEGLGKVAAVTREAVVYLAGRPEPLTSTLTTARNAPATTTPGSRRRVSMGTVPDFTYDGRGYRIGAVTPRSPAGQAGLQAGDIIVRCGDTLIGNGRVFAEVLKTLQPGETVSLTFVRDGVEHTVQTRVVSR
jgi:hypothetical protein